MLKKLLGIAPTLESDGSYSPSKLALKLATVEKSDYEPIAYSPYQGEKSKILVILTEHKNMAMQNGKSFSTGNHPIETLLPMLHLRNAGFEFEIATPTGKPMVFEMWAFPEKDEKVKAIYTDYLPQFQQPKSLQSLTQPSMPDAAAYAAVFIPGGHGAMLGLPEDENVGRVLHWAHDNDLFTITLCHGPAVLMSTALNGQPFLYKRYNMAVFPDSVDKMTPKIGYLPGPMPSEVSGNLMHAGVNLMNTKADNTVCVDRKLITGASPLASDALGKLAAKTLLDAVN